MDRLQKLAAIERHLRAIERCLAATPHDLVDLVLECRRFLDVAPEAGLGEFQGTIGAVRRAVSAIVALPTFPGQQDVARALFLFGAVRAALASSITKR